MEKRVNRRYLIEVVLLPYIKYVIILNTSYLLGL